jgi:hypothetical protein
VRRTGFKGFFYLQKFTGFLKTFTTKMVELIFYGSEKSEMPKTQLRCFCNTRNELFIGIREEASPEIWIALEKKTAIKFSKELRKQIALIEDEKGI